MTIGSANTARIDMELHIDRHPRVVWNALTEGIGAWWPGEFFAGGEDGARSYALEAWPGGRMVETWETGGGVLWGHVVCADPNKLLQVHGTTFPNWGGPLAWYGTWELKEKNGGTLLKFSESAIGRVSASGMAEKDKGWRFLWQVLKAHVEGTAVPVWQD